ncbi:MAG: FtsX-like permease family protein, partial [Tepidiformaceae bacterium]
MAADSILRLALRRSLASKRLMAVVALGVFVAASLLAAAPIYNRAMADIGLTFTIRDQLSASPSTQIHFNDVPLQTADGQALRSAVQTRTQQRIGWFSASEAQYTQLGRFGIADPGAPATPDMDQAQPQSLPGYESHVRVVSGRLPAATAAGAPMEVALSTAAAGVAQLKPGDLFDMREAFDTCERVLPQTDPPPPPPPCDPHATASFSYPAKVVGIIEPLDPQDPFWVGPASAYFDPFRLRISDIGPVLPMFTDQSSIMNGFASLYPGYRASISWNVFADPTKLNRANFQLARNDIIGLTADFQPLGGTAFSPLRDTLAKFAKSADFQQIPLTVLLLEISGIALFYVGLVSAIVVERQSAEIALLRSRGASLTQIATIYAWQGLVIGVPAVLLSPFLAAAATALLGATPIFHKVTGGSLLPVTVPPLSFLAAAIGVGLSLLALLPPALIVARRSTATQRRAESRPGRSVLHRYYLDLVFAGIAGLVLFELHQRGSAFEPSATGGLSSDPLLLAAPALVIAAAAALILRFYPMLLRAVARVVNAIAGASVSLGLAQVVRNSGQYTRLTLLLMMAVAVGSYGASYAATTNQSYRDRAGYDTGSDIRATSLGDVPLPEPTTDFESKLEAVPGVAQATTVTRAQAGSAAPGSITQSFQLIGVDPAAVSKMLWWRSDFSSKSLPDLMATLAAPAVVPGKPLPGNPTGISMWAKGDSTLAQVTIWARVRDATGRYTVVLLGQGDTGGEWKQLSAPIAPLSGGPLQAPITLVSIAMTLPNNGFVLPFTPVLVDDIS